jgi:hypothetical protein
MNRQSVSRKTDRSAYPVISKIKDSIASTQRVLHLVPLRDIKTNPSATELIKICVSSDSNAVRLRLSNRVSWCQQKWPQPIRSYGLGPFLLYIGTQV